MHIKLGSLEIDTRHGLFIRIPFIGAAHRHPRLGWIVDSWAEIRRIEGARPEATL
jgi:hypothetical protein